MKYSLKITQDADGESNISFAEADGAVAKDGSAEFTYNFDGAEYRLLLSRDKMTHIRLGGIWLEMNFERGKKSVCRLSDGSNAGSFCIFTDVLCVQFNGAVVTAECTFSDGADGGDTRISVLATPV